MANKTLDPNAWNLEDLFHNVYSIPVYQRPYSWDIEQVQVLLDDLYSIFISKDKQEGYFTGNIIIYDKNKKINGLINQYDIIDGQQRVTTFSLLLLSLYSNLSKKVDCTDQTLNDIKRLLWKQTDRKCQEDLRAVTLNSLEKEAFLELYNTCFRDPNNIKSFCDNYKFTSLFEKRIIQNYNYINNYLSEKLQNTEILLEFSDYIIKYVNFIVIIFSSKENKAFSMFESINSKGKKLDEIDKIKSYIFSKLDENSYQDYLNKWGYLIKNTNDTLYDYLQIYIKAYLYYYRQNISVTYFKSICEGNLITYFHAINEADAIKKLLDDLCNKVKYYNMLTSTELAYSFIKNNKFRFYYKIYNEIAYKHPRPLFFRSFIEYSENKIEKNDVISIVIETIKYMLKFLTIGKKDSKDAISMFVNIMNESYQLGTITKEIVINNIASELISQSISDTKIKLDLKTLDCYSQNKTLAVSLLALYESSTKDSDKKVKISFDQAYTLLNSFSESFSLDHILVQTPAKDSVEFKYYCNDKSNTLVLKDGNDFPEDIVENDMDYDIFASRVLNVIGNLRIYYKDKNSSRQNDSIELKNYEPFTDYMSIQNRSDEIINFVIDNCLNNEKIDLSKIKKISIYNEKNLPKMEELISNNVISVGDKIYLTVCPNNSEAVVLNDKFVQFNGNKISFNDWGCKLTGWKSIRIYSYIAKVGEIETLQQKRIDYVHNHTDE